jgi:hypothetical protein
MSSFAFWLALVLSQSSEQIISDYQKTVEANELAMSSAISCMDDQTKEVFQKQFLEQEPQRIVDLALEKCALHFDSMRDAISKNEILADQAEKITSEFRADLRAKFVEYILGLFSKPELSELRAKVAAMKLGDCVRSKIGLWASQPSEPETLAKAAVSSCTDEWSVWRTMQEYSLKSQKLGFGVSEFEPGFKAKLIESATVWVFEARAK